MYPERFGQTREEILEYYIQKDLVAAQQLRLYLFYEGAGNGKKIRSSTPGSLCKTPLTE